MNRLASLVFSALVLLCTISCGPSVRAPSGGQAPIIVSPIPPAGETRQLAVEAFVFENHADPSASYVGFRTYLFDADGTRLGVLVDGGEAAWSPDGSQVAFTAYDGKNHQNIYLHTADGQVIQLTAGASPSSSPVWSPDGARIAFQVEGAPTCALNCPHRQYVYVMNSDGSQITSLGEGIAPAWSPQGARLAFVSGWRDAKISILDLSGPKPVATPLANTSADPGPRPAWSPDGTRIAYVRVTNNGANSEGISVVDVASGQVTDVTDYFDHDPVWSPDGTRLALVRGSAYTEIYVVNADGSHLTQLTFGQDTAVIDSQVGWTPDGSRVTFLSMSDDQGAAQLCDIKPDGTGSECAQTDLNVGPQIIRLAWRP